MQHHVSLTCTSAVFLTWLYDHHKQSAVRCSGNVPWGTRLKFSPDIQLSLVFRGSPQPLQTNDMKTDHKRLLLTHSQLRIVFSCHLTLYNFFTWNRKCKPMKKKQITNRLPQLLFPECLATLGRQVIFTEFSVKLRTGTFVQLPSAPGVLTLYFLKSKKDTSYDSTCARSSCLELMWILK
jgi:hypothetical protein